MIELLQSYTEIQTYLMGAVNTLLASENLSQIKLVDHYNGQYLPDIYDHTNAFPMPAVFVEFASIEWQDYHRLQQEGATNVRLHICLERYSQGTNDSRDKDDFLKLLKIPAVINFKMHGFKGEYHNGLARRKDTPDSEFDMMYVHVIDYLTLMKTSSSKTTVQYVASTDPTREVSVTQDQDLVNP